MKQRQTPYNFYVESWEKNTTLQEQLQTESKLDLENKKILQENGNKRSLTSQQVLKKPCDSTRPHGRFGWDDSR